MLKPLLILSALLVGAPIAVSAQVAVRVEPSQLQGPRPLPPQTGAAAIHDYMASWQSLRAAFEQNQSALLDRDFVGIAREGLSQTIKQQASLGIRTHYQDLTHDIRIVLYSPDGLSIELTDNVEYDVQLIDHDRVKTAQRINTRYVIVMTPAEVRWRVRVFQAALK